MKPIVGMISPRHIEEDKPFENYTKFVSNYSKRIIDAGGIPIGIVFPDGKFNEELVKMCDGFLLQGGTRIDSFQINTVKYAIDNKKPLLGICLGLQTIVGYSWVTDKLGDKATYEEIGNYYTQNNELDYLKKVTGHNNLNPATYSEIEKSKHDIIIDKKSRLYKLYGQEKIKVPSFHNWAVKEDFIQKTNLFKITARSLDGNIEALEINDPNQYIIGVQYHPEVEDNHQELFNELVKEAKTK